MGDGLSEVLQNLVEISQDGTSYSGDLLSTIDVLRNMTEIFRRAYHSPTSGDVQVSWAACIRLRVWLPLFKLVRYWWKAESYSAQVKCLCLLTNPPFEIVSSWPKSKILKFKVTLIYFNLIALTLKANWYIGKNYRLMTRCKMTLWYWVAGCWCGRMSWWFLILGFYFQQLHMEWLQNMPLGLISTTQLETLNWYNSICKRWQNLRKKSMVLKYLGSFLLIVHFMVKLLQCLALTWSISASLSKSLRKNW